jgi:probable F420-dependent oxidoreductase
MIGLIRVNRRVGKTYLTSGLREMGMDIGIALPHMGREASPDLIVRIAQEAEQLRYASLWAGERMFRPRHYVPFGVPPGPMPGYFTSVYDPLETLSFIAAKTACIKLGTSVIDALFHAPVVLARRFATLDQLSGGRVIAGLGQGWMKEEFAAANISLRRRGNGFEDYVRALRACWGPDPVRYHGRFYTIIESDIGPKPLQVGGPPVLFGVASLAALRRAARLGDGLNPIALDWGSLEWLLRTYRTLVGKEGRDPQRMLIVVRSNYPVSPVPLPDSRPPLSGSLEQIKEDVQRLEALGVGHIFFDLAVLPAREQLQLLAKLRRVAT